MIIHKKKKKRKWIIYKIPSCIDLNVNGINLIFKVTNFNYQFLFVFYSIKIFQSGVQEIFQCEICQLPLWIITHDKKKVSPIRRTIVADLVIFEISIILPYVASADAD